MMKEDMKRVQHFLNMKGFSPGPIDGVGGPQTAAALEKCLRKFGLHMSVKASSVAFTCIPVRPASDRSMQNADYLPWMSEAARIMGRHEVRDNTFLQKWLRSDGKTLGDPAKLPWCGDFVETCIRLALPAEAFPGALGENPYWARNWSMLGVRCSPRPGAIMVFKRGRGGHVAFAIGRTATHFLVRGGNQGNRVSDVLISQDRLLDCRWPATFPLVSGQLPKVSRDGRIISTNEA